MLLRIFTEPQQGASYDDLLAVARVTEECGFDAFFRSDHYQAFGNVPGLPGPTDAWITLAGLARETSRIRLGTLVSPVTFRHPGNLAISVAQVDAMSGGRIELGLGTGWFPDEHASYGLAFPPIAERFELLAEQLEIVNGLWRAPAGETFSYTGSHYQVTDSPALPKPAQQPRPPIIIGGGGAQKTPALAARFADEFNLPFSPLDRTKRQFDRVRAACDAAGRDPGSLVLSAALTVACGSDEAEFARRAEAIGRTPENMRAWDAAGTPSEVIDRIGAYGEIGASRIYLQVMDLADLDHVRLLATDVMPHV